ncbi:immunity 42 family protein, partial [Achromobacter ruhlandii]|uniref:immunity 42 family protein n=1 Tax=Achromobacter ruhlandii TaxID=72557 RepID=UPI001C7050C1
KMPAFEWVHVQLHQQKGMISLSPPTICNSASFYERTGNTEFMCIESSLRFREIYDLGMNYFYGNEEAPFGAVYDLTCTSFGDRGIFVFYAKTTKNDVVVWSENEGKTVHGKILPLGTVPAVLRELLGGFNE